MTGQVLVLNATYEPLNVCSLRRACVLLLKSKAELIDALEKPLRSASASLPYPVVIRLLSYVRRPAGGRAAHHPPRRLRARRPQLPVLRRRGRPPDRRPRAPALARRPVELGQRRHGLRALQPAQGRPPAARDRHAAAQQAPSAVAQPLPDAAGDRGAARLARLPAAAARPLTPSRMEDEAELVALRRRVRELEALESVARGRARADRARRGAGRARRVGGDARCTPRCARSRSRARAARAARSRSAAARTARPTRSSARSPRSRRTSRTGASPIPLPTRRGAHGALVAWRSKPGRVQRARAGARRGRGRARRDGARRRARRDARPLRARGPPPRQEQPPDGRVAAAARRERRRRSRSARCATRSAACSRSPRCTTCSRRAATRTSTAPTSCAGSAGCCAARSTARSRPGRWRPSCSRPSARRRSRWCSASSPPTRSSTAAATRYIELRARRRVRRAHGQRPRPGPAAAHRDARAGTLDRARARRGRPRRHAALRAGTTACARRVRFPFVR